MNSLFNEKSDLNVRKKRASEAVLLEMVLLTENTFEATVTDVSSTSVTFTTPSLPAGDYDVIVNVDGEGNAKSAVGSLTSSMTVSGISPDTGSVHGGQTVTLTGNGFCTSQGDTTVTVGGADAIVESVTPGIVTFVTPAGTTGSAEVKVTSCTVS